MRTIFNIAVTFLFVNTFNGQTVAFKEQGKWGIKENEKIIISPKYDTIFNFAPDGDVCLACFVLDIANANKFIKSHTKKLTCNYLNKRNQALKITLDSGDSSTVFSFGNTTLDQLYENPSGFVVAAHGKKYLIDKNFKQLTFNGYEDVNFSLDKNFYHAAKMNEFEKVHAGLIDIHEREVIPFHYSKIKLNPVDSLISCCAAGVGNNLEDDVFDFSGKKIESYRRHVDLATKNFIIHKLFEPKELYIIYDLKTKEEKNLKADEVYFFDHDEILIKIKNDWYVYNLITSQKKHKQL